MRLTRCLLRYGGCNGVINLKIWGFALAKKITYMKKKFENMFSNASAGNRTRVNCLEGSYAHHYTTDAYNIRCQSDELNKNFFKWQSKMSLPWPGFEPGLLRPQRRVLTTRRSRLETLACVPISYFLSLKGHSVSGFSLDWCLHPCFRGVAVITSA